METKKVIEQSGIVNRNLTIKIDDDNKAILTQSSDFDHDEIVICEKHRTEVAKAIDPKYQETIDLNAKLLEALKNTIDHVLNRSMKIDIEATIELIHEAETKLKDNE